ncbi:hypothetical protein Tco_0556810 [Tanacetum coccineum]
MDLTLYRSLAGGEGGSSILTLSFPDLAPGALVFSYLLPLLIFRWFGLTKQTKHHSSALVLIEYWVLLMLLQKTTWIRIPLQHFICQPNPSSNTTHTKIFEIDIHFVRDMVKAGYVRVLHVPSRFQYADIFTKGLPSALFEDFCSSLSVWPPPAPTAGAY